MVAVGAGQAAVVAGAAGRQVERHLVLVEGDGGLGEVVGRGGAAVRAGGVVDDHDRPLNLAPRTARLAPGLAAPRRHVVADSPVPALVLPRHPSRPAHLLGSRAATPLPLPADGAAAGLRLPRLPLRVVAGVAEVTAAQLTGPRACRRLRQWHLEQGRRRGRRWSEGGAGCGGEEERWWWRRSDQHLIIVMILTGALGVDEGEALLLRLWGGVSGLSWTS